MSWPRVRLDECSEIVSGATPRTSVPEYWDGDILWATPKDLSNLPGKYLSDTPSKLTQSGYESCSTKLLPAQSVLFSSRAPIGHVAINAVPMCTNQGFKSFIPDSSRLSADYLYHWLRANKKYLQSLGNGATFKEVSKAIVSRVEIPLPPLPEQRRIAAILDQADALRAKRRQAIAKLDQLLQSVFLEMFGDPVTNPKGWRKSQFSELRSSVQIGPFGSLLHKTDYIDDGVPLVNPMHILSGKICPSRTQTVNEAKAFELSSYQLAENDVVIGRRGEMGRCAVVTSEESGFICGTGSLFIRPDAQELDSQFLCFALSNESMKRHLESLSQGVTMPNLNSSMIRALEVILPPLSTQKKFNKWVFRVHANAGKFRQAEKLQDQLFAALQHDVFSAIA